MPLGDPFAQVEWLVIYLHRYHHKVPDALPDLDLKASYGLVTAEEFKLPEPNPLWTAESYKSFNIAANVNNPSETVRDILFEIVTECHVKIKIKNMCEEG